MRQTDRQCILCLQTILGRTKPEHILLNALGGRATVRDIVCSECNAAMGRAADQDLADSVAMLRNIANLLSGDGRLPPIIHGMSSEGMTFDVTPGMQVKPRREGKKVSVSRRGGQIDILISATSERELDALLSGAARAVAKELGHSDPKIIEAIRTDLISDNNRNDSIVPAPPIMSELQFGQGRSQQSMAKAALVLWTRLVGCEEVSHPRYGHIRRFIWTGEKPGDPESLAMIDGRPIPETPEQFGTNPNIIQVVSDFSGAVYGYFRLYGAIGWRFLLCAHGAPANRAYSLISNPFQNETFQFGADDKAILPPAWILADWNRDLMSMTSVLDRLNFLISHGIKNCRRTMIKNWISDAIYNIGCKHGDRMTKSQIEYITEYTWKRIFVYIMRTPIYSKNDRP